MSARQILEQLRTESEGLEHSVIQNSVQDIAHYKFLVGQIRGLQKAIEICINTFKETGEIE